MKSLILPLVFLWSSFAIAQTVTYDYFTLNSESLKSFLYGSDEYFSGGPAHIPYFQGKNGNVYIKFFESIGPGANIDFQSRETFLELVRSIKKNASFKYRYNGSYDEPVVYNYVTPTGNEIRFNYTHLRVQVSFPSKLSKAIANESDILPVFVCLSKEAYAYHTNLRCEGLNNCTGDIAKTNIREAKKYNFRMCEICSDDE